MELNEYELKKAGREQIYEKLIAILMADPLGWELMCRKVQPTYEFHDPTAPTANSNPEGREASTNTNP